MENTMTSSKDRYIAEVAEHGRCTESGDYKRGNAAFDRMKIALAELRRSPDRGESTLIELLDHPNEWVKVGAATHLLPLRADLSIAVLEALASERQGMIGFDAEMVLREWRAGSLKVP
jgi:hypothetical protein